MAKDIEIQIGAQDAASKVLADISDNMKNLGADTKRMADVAEKSTSRIEIAFKSVAASAASYLAFDKIRDSISSAARAAMEASRMYEDYQRATVGLTAAQKQLARELESFLLVPEEEIASVIKLADSLKVNEEQMESLTLAAYGLAKATGDDAVASLRDLLAFAQGDKTAFDELIPTLKGVEDAQGKFALIVEQVNIGLQRQTEELGTAAGASTRAQLAMENFQVQVGASLAPAKAMAASFFSTLIDGATSYVPSAEILNSAILSNANVMTSLQKKAIEYAVVIESAFTSIPDYVSFAAAKFGLALETMRADAEHTFTVTIPAYGEWFSREFPGFIVSAAQSVQTVLMNLVMNSGEIMSLFMDAITGNLEGGFTELGQKLSAKLAIAVAEGAADLKVPELPEIPERQQTTLEILLEDKAFKSSMAIANNYVDTLKKRMASFELQLGKVDTPELPNLQAALDAIKTAAADAEIKATGAKGTNEIAAVESRLLTRGPSEDPMLTIAKDQVKQLEAVNANSKTTNTILDRIQDRLVPGDSLQVEVIT